MPEDKEDIYSNAVRAGKRTYFFDVRATRGRDLYLTITESKKRTHADGSFHYQKHKLYLYKEDFEKFLEGFQETLKEIDRLRATGNFKEDMPYDEGVSDSRSASEPKAADRPSIPEPSSSDSEDPVKKIHRRGF